MIKDIVVHLTGSPEDTFRLDCAESFATRFDAHLTGLLMHLEPSLMATPDIMYGEILQQLTDEAHAATRRHLDALAPRFGQMSQPNDLRIVSGTMDGIGEELAAEARTSDLFIGTRPYGDPDRSHKIEETVLFGSGGPSLFLVPRKPAAAEMQNVLIAWKSRREAARAVRDALPILRNARLVTIAVVADEPEEQPLTSSTADLALYLSRHGVKSEIKELTGSRSAAEALLNEIAFSAPDLIVAGAYGHSRLRERLLGGVTRALLSKADVPIFMSR